MSSVTHKRSYCLGFFSLLALTSAQADTPIAREKGIPIQVASHNIVVITFQGASLGTLYSNDLYLETAQGSQLLFNNKTTPVQTQIALGKFRPGSELKLRLHVNNSGLDYYSGPASLNPDGKTHARIESDWQPNEALVSFEDADDFLFNDLSVSISNVNQSDSAACRNDHKAWIGHHYDIHIPAVDYTDASGKHQYLSLDFDYAPNAKGEAWFKLRQSGESKP